MGLGKIDGRPVAIGGEDYTIRARHRLRQRPPQGRPGRLHRRPRVRIPHSAGQPDRRHRRHGQHRASARATRSFPGYGQDGFERSAELLGIVPVVCAVMGTTAGGPSMRAILSHWSIMVKGTGQIFAAGPPVVERAFGAEAHQGRARRNEDRGRYRRHDRQRRRRRSRLPRADPALPLLHAAERVGAAAASCAPAIRSIAAKTRSPTSCRARRAQAYNMKKLIELVVDRDSLFEIQPTFGRALDHRARAHGRQRRRHRRQQPDVRRHHGCTRRRASRAHFVELCDMFNIPLVFFADVPGLHGRRRIGSRTRSCAKACARATSACR